MSVPEIVLEFAQTYGIDPDVLFGFSCLFMLGVLGGVVLVFETVNDSVMLLVKSVKARIRLRRREPGNSPDEAD